MDFHSNAYSVIPKIYVWYVTPRSRLSGCQPAPLEYYMEIMIHWYEV